MVDRSIGLEWEAMTKSEKKPELYVPIDIKEPEKRDESLYERHLARAIEAERRARETMFHDPFRYKPQPVPPSASIAIHAVDLYSGNKTKEIVLAINKSHEGTFTHPLYVNDVPVTDLEVHFRLVDVFGGRTW